MVLRTQGNYKKKKQKIIDKTEARKERKKRRRKICDLQAKKNAEAKELFSCQHYNGQMSGPSSP